MWWEVGGKKMVEWSKGETQRLGPLWVGSGLRALYSSPLRLTVGTRMWPESQLENFKKGASWYQVPWGKGPACLGLRGILLWCPPFLPFSLLSVHMMVGARSHCFFYFNSTLSQNSKSISVNSRFLKTALHSPTLLSLNTHACMRTHTHTHTHIHIHNWIAFLLE